MLNCWNKACLSWFKGTALILVYVLGVTTAGPCAANVPFLIPNNSVINFCCVEDSPLGDMENKRITQGDSTLKGHTIWWGIIKEKWLTNGQQNSKSAKAGCGPTNITSLFNVQDNYETHILVLFGIRTLACLVNQRDGFQVAISPTQTRSGQGWLGNFGCVDQHVIGVGTRRF